MSKIFITGSADGLGELSARALVSEGHQVMLHARTAARGRDAMRNVAGATGVLIGDLSSTDDTKKLAHEADRLGPWDAIIHNAGVYRTSAKDIFAVNTLAPYILTALMQKPKRLIYLSSGMHLQGRPHLEAFTTNVNQLSYSDSKLHVLLLSKAVNIPWPDVYSNTVDPGWVPTKMGGRGAPDDLHKGYETQAWLAVSDDSNARVTGRYFHHKQERRYNPIADDIVVRNSFIARCAEVTGVPFPSGT